MRREIHPINGFEYLELGDGLVRVTNKRGQTGVFDWQGHWQEGAITHADPHFLQYVGGPNLPEGFDMMSRAAAQQHLEETTKRQSARAGTQTLERPDDAGDAAAQAYEGTLIDPRRLRLMFAQVDEPMVGKYVGDPGRMTPKGMRSKAIAFQELVANDSHPERVPAVLREDAPMPGGVTKVPVERYFDPKYHDLEVEKLWKKVWQFACREDDIPEIGDYIVYDVAHLSWLVVRVGERQFKAFNNACLHRGRQLREFDGKCATEFRCPFHGWCWEIDGTLREIPSEWDYPGVREDVSELREAKVGLWGGFVFINPDPNCEPLEGFLGSLPEHYARYDYDKRYKQMHVAKIINANWKLVQEAFSEGYHVLATHPQAMLLGGDGSNHNYDAFGNWCRAVTTAAGSSAHRGIYLPDEEIFARRAAAADATREMLRPAVGDKVDIYCDAELVDGYYNNLFPNLHPWGAFSRICYRFRPYGDAMDKSIMEVLYLVPWPEGQPKPPPTPIHWLSEDEDFTHSPEMGPLARVLNQDLYNLPKMQAGLRTKADPYVYLSAYAEGKVRHFNALYDEWLGLA
jgi:nitrite reductase/ring-hydroxylating ferredoxin subunit